MCGVLLETKTVDGGFKHHYTYSVYLSGISHPWPLPIQQHPTCKKEEPPELGMSTQHLSRHLSCNVQQRKQGMWCPRSLIRGTSLFIVLSTFLLFFIHVGSQWFNTRFQISILKVLDNCTRHCLVFRVINKVATCLTTNSHTDTTSANPCWHGYSTLSHTCPPKQGN